MPKTVPRETIDQILPTYKACSSYAEVADKLGISVSTVGRVIRKSEYDRYHVGGVVSRSIPISNEEPSRKDAFSITSRTLKLRSNVTGLTYTVSTESDVIEIESDTALMQIQVNMLEQFAGEIKNIQSLIGTYK
jgi:hypothetical protein